MRNRCADLTPQSRRRHGKVVARSSGSSSLPSQRGGRFLSPFQEDGDLLEARMPSMNSCRVIFPSWSLSMRRKKSMTRDFLWFIQRMYFFRQTSKSKFANSFNWKEIESQCGKSPEERHPAPQHPLHQPPGDRAWVPANAQCPSSGRAEPGEPRSRGAARTDSPEQHDTQRSPQHHADRASRQHRHGMKHPPRPCTDTDAELATCTQTHTHPPRRTPLGCLLACTSPANAPTLPRERNTHGRHPCGCSSPLSLSPFPLSLSCKQHRKLSCSSPRKDSGWGTSSNAHSTRLGQASHPLLKLTPLLKPPKGLPQPHQLERAYSKVMQQC